MSSLTSSCVLRRLKRILTSLQAQRVPHKAMFASCINFDLAEIFLYFSGMTEPVFTFLFSQFRHSHP
nr:MAG TPA: hypothetical protein [Bacteriophage sp.]